MKTPVVAGVLAIAMVTGLATAADTFMEFVAPGSANWRVRSSYHHRTIDKEPAMVNFKLTTVRWIIWINMVLWLMAFGAVMTPLPQEHGVSPKYVVGTGFLFSALLQHWGYYRLRKSCRAESMPARAGNHEKPE